MLVAKRAERALVALVLDAEVPELARAVMLARRPQERRVYAADGEETVHVRGGHLRQGARHARLILRGIHVTHGAECTGAVVEAQLHFVRLAHGAASGGFKTVVSGKAKTVALALHGCQSAHHGGVLSGKHRVCLAVGMRCGRGGTYAIRVVVGAGCVVISGLSKACLRARAWCDVAPANAVCCVASEGEQSSDDASFLWPGGKYGIRRRERTGDAHKEVVYADGRDQVSQF